MFNLRNNLGNDLTWGEGYPNHENHSRSLMCPECSKDYRSMDLSELSKYLVGIQETLMSSGEAITGYSDSRPYSLIIECSCFTRFWWHASKHTAKKLKEIKQNKD